MSHTDLEQMKRRGSLSQDPLDAKKFKTSDIVEEEESSEDKLSSEELKLSLPFEVPNLILRIGGRKLNVRKEHLVAASPVFDKMLSADFKEAKLTEIPLPEKKCGNFIRFLRYILPGFTDELKEDTVHDMLPLAEEYQTDDFKQRIDIFLANFVKEQGNKISSTKIVEYTKEAELYNLPSYLHQCIDVAARKLSQNLTKFKEYQDISKDTRLKIYSMRCSIIDTSLQKGTIQKSSAGSIYVGLRKTDGEKLKDYLQNN